MRSAFVAQEGVTRLTSQASAPSLGLQLAPDLVLPLDAVTRTFGILAVRGAGKSNTAAVMAEEMFAAGLPFVVVDPVGSWFGLRSSADGSAPGLAIPIFGGKRGDIPLERSGGELVADLVVERRLSVVLDLSGFESEGDKKAFLLAFARRLYQKNELPLHLFLEEADDYIPQRPMRDEAQLLRAFENIVRRGRARGLGITLITQRSAALSKMVLTQVETLFAMRTTGPQDRAAVEEWVKYHLEGREVLASLPGLKDGEAWVWSPHFLGVTKRVQVRRRRTFDSGATPTNVRLGDHRPAATLADVDLDAVRASMADTIERAKADDPRELRKRIAVLERELAQLPVERMAKVVSGVLMDFSQEAVPELKDIEGLGYALRRWAEGAARPSLSEDATRGIAETLRLVQEEGASVVSAIEGEVSDVKSHLDGVRQRIEMAFNAAVDRLLETAEPALSVLASLQVRPSSAARDAHPAPPSAVQASHRPPPLVVADWPPPGSAPAAKLSSGERKILTVLAQSGEVGRTKVQIALLTNYAHSGGGFNNYLSALRSKGWIGSSGSDRLVITAAGAAVLGTYPALPPAGDELFAQWRRQVGKAEGLVLEALRDAYPRALTKERLAATTGYEATGGGFNNALGKLRTLELIHGRGELVLAEERA
jgi:hypothetical protein